MAGTSDIRSFLGQGQASNKKEDQPNKVKRRAQQSKYDCEKRKRTVQDSWLEEFSWAEEKDGKLICTVCKQFPALADTRSSLFKGVTSNFKKETLKFHDKSVKHNICLEHQKVIESPSTSALAVYSLKVDKKNTEQYEKLMNTAYYEAQESEAFSKFAGLCNLQEKNGVEIGKNYRNIHGCRSFIAGVSDTLKNETSSDIEEARFISVLSDGSTDKGVIEQEIVYTRFVNKKGQLCTRLADIVDLEHGNAEGVKNGIFKALENVGLPTEGLSDKLVGINTDGASVNLGKKGGAVKLMMNDLNEHLENPCDDYMVVVHCIAHKLELAVCDSKKGCEYLNKLEDILKGIFKFYFYSPKKRRELYDIAVSLDKELKHYGGIHQVRWVASQNRALKSLLDNYEVTCIHLEDIASKTGDDANRAKGYLKEIKTERFLTFIHFMIDWTDKITRVSEAFKKNTCVVATISKEICALKDGFNHMKVRRGNKLKAFLRETRDSEQFKGINIVKCTQQGRHADSMERVNNEIDALLNDTVFFLEERFINHIGGEPHSLFNVFDFTAWPQKDASPDQFLSYGDEEIEKLVQIYGPLLTDEEQTNAPGQWLDLKNEICKNLNRTILEVYLTLMEKHDERLSSILPIVNIMLTISPSTAQCERGFSSMNIVKTQYRTSLKQESLSNLFRIKCDGPPLSEFNPTDSLVTWERSGKGIRHLKGHKLPGKRAVEARRETVHVSSSDSE